jgi:hypothetical protein
MHASGTFFNGVIPINSISLLMQENLTRAGSYSGAVSQMGQTISQVGRDCVL